MFRHFVLIVLCSLFVVSSVAQGPIDTSTAPAPDNTPPPSPRTSNGRYGEAADAHISIARLKEPPKARRLYEKAMRAWIKGAPAEAERKLDQALQIDPAFPEALILYGGIQSSLQQWETAEQKLHEAIRIDPSYSPAYIILAGVYNAQSRFEEAHDVAQKALSAGANNWDVQYEIARALIGKRDYESALVTTEMALREKRHGSLLHLAKAHALLGLRRYRQATVELKVFLRYQPSGDGSEQARSLLELVQNLSSP